MMPLHKALLDMVESSMTYKATTGIEEEVGVIWGKLRQRIEGITIDSN
jgi:hypothetical protein